jgi:uncharacterized membrane protein
MAAKIVIAPAQRHYAIRISRLAHMDVIMTKRTRHNRLSWIGLILGILSLLVFSLSLPTNLALLPTHPAYASVGLSNGLFSLAFFVLWIRSERKVDAIDEKLKTEQP